MSSLRWLSHESRNGPGASLASKSICARSNSCASDDMKWMIFRQKGFQVPGRFPRLFLIRQNPATALRDAQSPCSPRSHLAGSSTSTPSGV